MSSGVMFPIGEWPNEFYSVHAWMADHVDTANRNMIWIAGGAVRDHVLHRPIKDFDIFVLARNPDHEAAHLSAIADDVNEWGNEWGEQRSSSVPETMRRFQFKPGNGFLNWSIKRPLDVILPEVMHISSVLEQFDIGICKIAWQPGALYVHPHFVEDAANRVVWQRTYGLWTRQSSNAHMDRLMHKYAAFERRMLGPELGKSQTAFGELNELRTRLAAQSTEPRDFEGADFDLLDNTQRGAHGDLLSQDLTRGPEALGQGSVCLGPGGKCACHNSVCMVCTRAGKEAAGGH